jgi:hypothetical protein
MEEASQKKLIENFRQKYEEMSFARKIILKWMLQT